MVHRHDTSRRPGARLTLGRRANDVSASPVLLHRTVRVPTPPARRALVLAVLLAAFAYAGLLAAALAGSLWPFLAFAVAVTLVEPALAARAPVLLWGTCEVQLGVPWRWAIQGVALLCLVGAVPGPHRALGAALVVAVLALGLCFGALGTFAEGIGFLRKSPLLGRNLDLTGLSVPPAPSLLLTRPVVVLAPLQLALLVAGGLTAAHRWPTSTGIIVLAAVVLLALVPVAIAGTQLLATWRANPRTAAATRVRRALADLRPEVLLYYGGGPHALYQVQMWLRVLERAPLRTLVVLRDPASLRRLAPTTLPVVSATSNALLMTLELPTARAALFVANAANNAHLLRRRGLATAFIGHGDSDKFATTSPFLKTYDEVWVAGPAGAARLTLHMPGLLGRIRQVGRPQAVFLPPMRHAPEGAPSPTRTVLYAPTWEGWGDERHNSSLQYGAVELVRRLLAAPGVRLVYRPHPLTGSRDLAVKAADRQIVELMHAAGAPPDLASAVQGRSATAGSSATDGSAAAGDRDDVAHRDELDELDHLDDLALMVARSQPRGSAPDHNRSPDHDNTSRHDQGDDHDHDDDHDDDRPRNSGSDEQFWRDAPPTAPRVSRQDRPSLVSCFRHSDLLIADVSSVLSDWVALDRPLAVIRPPHLTEEDFIAAYPTASAGALLGPDGAGLDALLADLSAHRDPYAARRRALREDLLGSPPEAGQQRFEAALAQLAASSPPDRSPADRSPADRTGLPA